MGLAQILADWRRIHISISWHYYLKSPAYICVNKLTIIGSGNGLSPGQRQAITWTNAGILLNGPLGTNSSEILSEIHTFSFKKMHVKMSSGMWQPFCLGLNVLIPWPLMPSLLELSGYQQQSCSSCRIILFVFIFSHINSAHKGLSHFFLSLKYSESPYILSFRWLYVCRQVAHRYNEIKPSSGKVHILINSNVLKYTSCNLNFTYID